MDRHRVSGGHAARLSGHDGGGGTSGERGAPPVRRGAQKPVERDGVRLLLCARNGQLGPADRHVRFRLQHEQGLAEVQPRGENRNHLLVRRRLLGLRCICAGRHAVERELRQNDVKDVESAQKL